MKILDFRLSSFELKIIAILAMVCDHLAYAFIPKGSLLSFIMHFIGNLTFPIIACFIAEGFHYTKNPKKYLIRLVILAVVSQFAYAFCWSVVYEIDFLLILFGSTNVIVTLILGFLTLTFWKKDIKIAFKVLSVIMLVMVSLISEWMIIGVLFIFFAGVFKEQSIKKWSLIIITASAYIVFNGILEITSGQSLFKVFSSTGVFVAILLLSKVYDPTIPRPKQGKYLFYLFYPLHFIIIGLLKILS